MAEGTATQLITAAMLRATDAESANANLTFTADGASAHGTLKRAGVNLAAGGTFTQADRRRRTSLLRPATQKRSSAPTGLRLR